MEEEALTPKTVPSSINLPLPKAEAEVQIADCPTAPADKAACLLLKVDQSVEVRQPETEAEELGQLMTKDMPVPKLEVEILKILPAVPVETLLSRLAGRFKVNKLEVEVAILKTLPPVEVAMLGMALEAAVIKPLPLTVKEGICPELPKLPTLELTVAKVKLPLV